jgi:hypothetical protein
MMWPAVTADADTRARRSEPGGSMSENKTRATEASVEDYLAAIPDPGRRADCRWLAELMSRVTGCAPKMWGPSIVGFDQYHYRYASGREGDMCVTGFSSRKGGLAVYLVVSGPEQEALLGRLGRHQMGKSCLTLRRLSDVDREVLEQLVADSVAEVRRRHG